MYCKSPFYVVVSFFLLLQIRTLTKIGTADEAILNKDSLISEIDKFSIPWMEKSVT